MSRKIKSFIAVAAVSTFLAFAGPVGVALGDVGLDSGGAAGCCKTFD